MEPLQLFKCLADETRLKIIMLISQYGELCVCELMEALNEAQPKVSRHLAQLRKCHLLEDRKNEQWVFYRFSPDLAAWIVDIIKSTAASNSELIDPLSKRLKAMNDRPGKSFCC